jgi:hypothetical protein
LRALNRRASQSTTQSYAEKDTSAVKKAALLVEPGLQKGGFGDIPEKEPEKQGGVGRGVRISGKACAVRVRDRTWEGYFLVTPPHLAVLLARKR